MLEQAEGLVSSDACVVCRGDRLLGRVRRALVTASAAQERVRLPRRATAGIIMPAYSGAFLSGGWTGMPSTQNGSIDRAALCPLTDVLIRRHGWSHFDFKITANMGARRSAKFDWSKGFGAEGMCRGYLRSMKRYRRWLGIDHITYFDELMAPGDPILFEKSRLRVDYPPRHVRNMGEACRVAVR